MQIILTLGGNSIQGTNVIASRKNAGPWGQGGGLRAPAWDYVNNTGYFYHTASYYLGKPQSFFITMANNHGDFNPSTGVFIPSVICNPTSGTGGGGYYNGHGWTIEWLEKRMEKLLELPKIDTSAGPGDTSTVAPTPPIGNLWSIMADLELEAELNINGFTESDDNIGPFGIGTNFSEFVTGFYVTDFFDPETRVEFKPSEWLSPTEEFQGPDGELPSGFYILTAAFSNGEIFTRAVDAEEGIDYRYDKCDMVGIVVFPSPLDRNEAISFEFLSSITTSVDYELLDQYGNTCLTYTFSLSKGDNNFQLNIPPSLGSGLVFHRFIFSDASVKVIESIID